MTIHQMTPDDALIVVSSRDGVYIMASAPAQKVMRTLAAEVIRLRADNDAADDMRGTLDYLRTQAKNGTLHPQVVIQNVDAALTAWENRNG